MEELKSFMVEQGFEEAMVAEYLWAEDAESCLLESCEGLYREYLALLREEFDDWFVLQMFAAYTSVFMRTDFAQQLEAVRQQFGTDMWATLMQYELSKTGESTVFALMDTLSEGSFEEGLQTTCESVRSLWVQDYGDADL